MALLQKFKVSGHSMMPTLKPNQEIIVSSLPYLFKKPGNGDIIAFKENGQFIVKRIKKTGKDRYLVQGDNKEDSREYGWIDKKKIIGKVIYP